MAFYLVTPQPILVEAESVSDAVAKAQQTLLGGTSIRYEIKTPTQETLWMTAEAEAQDKTILGAAPVSSVLPKAGGGAELPIAPSRWAVSRFLRGLWLRN